MPESTRRDWFKAGAAAMALTPAIGGLEAAAPQAQTVTVTPPDYLHAAREAARWIATASQIAADGIHWTAQPDHPELPTSPSKQLGVYSGSAGVVLFLLQLAKATGDNSYRDQATKGADYLVAHWKDLSTTGSSGPAGSALSFYNGLAGIAFTLAEAWKWTGEARYRDAALEVTNFIVQSAKPAGAGVTWAGSPGLSGGDTGVVLYLLYAASAFHDDSYKPLAARAGEHILELAEKDPRGGVRWFGPSRPGAASTDPRTYFPNFELGTAGVAYGLARLFAETRDARFLEGARQGALHLQKIATVAGDSALIYYREPDLTNLYYLGFCHGPSGTARLFYELYTVTKEREYLGWTERLARGITGSGIPEILAPGFWYVNCQCCGLAGVTDFLLGLWAGTHKPEYLAFARRAAEQALSRVTDLNNAGYRWYQAWTRVTPWVVTAETGHMVGAAGIATSLLHLHLADQRRYEAIVFPDNPFPNTVSA